MVAFKGQRMQHAIDPSTHGLNKRHAQQLKIHAVAKELAIASGLY
jgi:hypothetical protein